MVQPVEEQKQSVKFGIALPKPVVHEIEAEAKKLGMTRSEFIAKVLTGELRNNRERDAVTTALRKSGKPRTPDDNLSYIYKLLEDSNDWLDSFDLQLCASQAVARSLIADELNPRLQPSALLIILRRYKQQADYWGYSQERKKTELDKFGKDVGVKEADLQRAWSQVEWWRN